MCLLGLLMEWFVSFRFAIMCRIVLGICRIVILLCSSIRPFTDISSQKYSTKLQIFLLPFFLFDPIVIESYCTMLHHVELICYFLCTILLYFNMNTFGYEYNE